jgi:uncharacterized protein (DUF2461 family)
VLPTGPTEAGRRSLDPAPGECERAVYETQVVAPTKSFVVAIGDRLSEEVVPDIVAQPKANGSIAPINNDLRFSPAKSPYKDHLLLRFWEGPQKKAAPTLMVRIGPGGIGFATGTILSSPDHWRDLIDDDTTGAPLAAALDELVRGRDLDLAGEGCKRVPKPYPADHPRADLLRHKVLQSRWQEPVPDEITTPAFVDWSMARLDACADVHHWLVANL